MNKVYRAVELENVISKDEIDKILGGEIEKVVTINVNGLTYELGLGRDDMYDIWCGVYDRHLEEVISEEYDFIGEI